MYIIGRVLGAFMQWFIKTPVRILYGLRSCNYYNVENLTRFKGDNFVIVANHIKPRSRLLQNTFHPYDFHLLQKQLETYGFNITALATCDSVRPGNFPAPGEMQKYLNHTFIRGAIKSMGLIPIGRKALNLSSLKALQHRLKYKPGGIVIFPENTWHRGFRKSRKLYPAAAIFAKRFNLPILPVFINAYNLHAPIDIRIGKLFFPVEKTNQVLEEIRTQLNALKERGSVPSRNNAVQSFTERPLMIPSENYMEALAPSETSVMR